MIISTLSFISSKRDPNDPSSFTRQFNTIYAFKDNSGVFWIASYGQGLNIYNSKQKQFRNYKQESGNPFSLKGDIRVTSIIEDRTGTIWMGTWNGGFKSSGIEKQISSIIICTILMIRTV